jgi:hypothetical protein
MKRLSDLSKGRKHLSGVNEPGVPGDVVGGAYEHRVIAKRRKRERGKRYMPPRNAHANRSTKFSLRPTTCRLLVIEDKDTIRGLDDAQ